MAAFLIDAQLPPVLASRLRLQGHRAEHVCDIGWNSAADDQIAHYAAMQGAVLISKDEDFACMVQKGALPCQLLWIRLGNTTNIALWEALEPKLQLAIDAFEAGNQLVEIV